MVEGVRFYKEAIEVILQLLETNENKTDYLEVVLAMRKPVGRTGYSEDYLPLLKKAEALAEELGDDKKIVQIRSILGYRCGGNAAPYLLKLPGVFM